LPSPCRDHRDRSCLPPMSTGRRLKCAQRANQPAAVELSQTHRDHTTIHADPSSNIGGPGSLRPRALAPISGRPDAQLASRSVRAKICLLIALAGLTACWGRRGERCHDHLTLRPRGRGMVQAAFGGEVADGSKASSATVASRSRGGPALSVTVFDYGTADQRDSSPQGCLENRRSHRRRRHRRRCFLPQLRRGTHRKPPQGSHRRDPRARLEPVPSLLCASS
jgi:hypothetical protein